MVLYLLPSIQVNSSLINGDSTIKAFTTSELSDESLKNLEITTPPIKTAYFEGGDFDQTGMIVKANYHSKTNPSVVLDSSSYSITNGTNLKVGQTSVTITYEDKSIEQPITVAKNNITELKIKAPPAKTEYKEGQNFDKTGMVITGGYQDGETHEITDYIIVNGTNLTKEQSSITIKYEEKTTTQAITVGEKAKNSNFDDAKCDIKKVQAYYYTDHSQENYTLINLQINNISRILTNDSLVYYYYLSTNNNEQNIDKWIKITNPQNSKDTLSFIIDTRNVSNYHEIASEDVLYLYIKEVATKGENQSIAVSKSMKLEIDKKIETYVNNIKKENFDTNTSINSTIATGKLPNAGIKITLITFIVAMLGIGIYAYVKYKNLNHYLK